MSPAAAQVVLGIATPTGPSAGGADISTASDQNTPVVSDQLIATRQQHGSSGNLAGSSSGGGAAAAGSSGSIGGSAEAGSYGVDQGSGSSSAAAAAGKGSSSSPTKQLLSPSAVPLPRMSNAFARKHGLDPKENPLVNLQRLAFQQQVQPQPAGVSIRQRKLQQKCSEWCAVH